MADDSRDVFVAPRVRPLGLKLGAVLLLLFAIFGLLGAVTGILLWHGYAASVAFYVIDGLLALCELILVWALWALKPWAFWATVGVEIVCVVIALLVFLVWRSASSILTNLVFPIAILLCLFVDPNVRSAFHNRFDEVEQDRDALGDRPD